MYHVKHLMSQRHTKEINTVYTTFTYVFSENNITRVTSLNRSWLFSGLLAS
jgi:hypothetical protein